MLCWCLLVDVATQPVRSSEKNSLLCSVGATSVAVTSCSSSLTYAVVFKGVGEKVNSKADCFVLDVGKEHDSTAPPCNHYHYHYYLPQ